MKFHSLFLIALYGLFGRLQWIRAEECAQETLSCDLRVSSVCGWCQDDDDDFDWTWHERITPTSFTGPNHAHSGNFYFYIETDPPRSDGDTARLKSPPFKASTRVRHWFSFWFFMWGSGVNELRVSLEDNYGVKHELWSIQGEQERKWQHANVTYDIPRHSALTWYSLVFEGVTGVDQQSDIAIDTFKASPTICRYQSSQEVVILLHSRLRSYLGDPTHALYIVWMINLTGSGACSNESTELQPSFDCSFDTASICGQQDVNNLFEWAWRVTTFTYRNDVDTIYYDWYLFVDNTHALEYGDTTAWISPSFGATSSRHTDRCITFKYLMDGEDIKFLHTYLQDRDEPRKLIWSRYGHQGRKWRVASVTFSVVTGQHNKIIMEVERGMVSSPWTIAINDVRVADKSCYVTSQRPHVEKPVYPKTLTCSFETSSLCGWIQDSEDDFNWTHRYNTPFANAPSTGNTVSVNHRIGACSGSSNYFLDVMQNYMTDIPNKGLRAILRSQKLDATSGEQRCLGFYYYMDYGKFGILRVYQLVDDNASTGGKLLWEKNRDHGKEWNKAEITYNTTGSQWEYIEFEAERGPLKDGDIGIDDVTLAEVSCEVLHTPEMLPKSLSTCSFNDDSLCGWQQSLLDDDFDWTRHSGSTPSSYTGPNGAHDSAEGFYMFIEASSPRTRYDKAELWSPHLDGTAGEQRCLTFFYNMYGTGIGRLIVFQYGNYVFQEILILKGSKGTGWQREQVTFDTSGGAKEQVVFRAERGWSNRGDIAVDDVSIVIGAC